MELNLKEKIIFAKFKDRPIEDFKKFREQQSEKLGFPISDNLIRELKKYQRNKFSKIQHDSCNPYFCHMSPKCRKNDNIEAVEFNRERKTLERLEKNQKTYVWSRTE